MPFVLFLRENARWLSGAFLLTFFSAFGQTFFISLSAGEIRAEFDLSHGEFGSIYMAATLMSALTLQQLGRVVDWWSTVKVTMFIVPLLALASLGMAFSGSIFSLFLVIYALRLFGQGMMTHNALTAMGRWYAAQRGRAVSVATLGHNVSEAIMPLVFVAVSGVVGWRNSWALGALVLVVCALPLIVVLMRVERQPRSSDPKIETAAVRDWTRREVVRDPLFWIMLTGVMAPAFIGTSIFFHQVYLVELRGWSLEVFASSFIFMAMMTILFVLISGHLIDRFSAVKLLPGFLLPLSAACLALGLSDAQAQAFVFMGLLGVSYGISSTLFGALWPEIYGVKHLGSVRSLVVAIMVFMTAVGPGLTGFLIDRGIEFPSQIVVMGLYCIAGSAVLFVVARMLRARLQIENGKVEQPAI